MSVPFKYNFRNLVVRKGSTAMTIAGFMLVVCIFVVVMAMIDGLEATLVSTGAHDNVIVMNKGAESETSSLIMQSENALQVVGGYKGVKRDAKNEPLLSPEHLASISMKMSNGEQRGMSIRGVKPVALDVHEKVKVVKGKAPSAGMWEVMVGSSLHREFESLSPGKSLSFLSHQWEIVGVFEAGGSSFESEIWTDVDIIKTARDSAMITSIVVKAESGESVKNVVASIIGDNRIELQAEEESEYYAKQNSAAKDMKVFGYAIAVIMSLGAIFGAMNTMFASIGERIKEIGTLRAVGFSKMSILVSFVLESLTMGLAGGLIGCLLSLGMNGYSMTIAGKGFTALAFQFTITPTSMAMGMAFAALMGILGGILPAANAARLPIVRSLREF